MVVGGAMAPWSSHLSLINTEAFFFSPEEPLAINSFLDWGWSVDVEIHVMGLIYLVLF
jgi:hypothetical protein